jgi:ketosteroid isomerase-like protein
VSEETLRLARERYEAWNRCDLEAMLGDVPPEFEFHTAGVLPDVPAVIRGPEGLRELFDTWYSGPWQGNLIMHLNHIVDLGDDRVLALITFRGTGEGSGVPVELKYAHLATFKDTILVRLDGFDSWGRGLRAAGLDEIPPGS